MSSLRNSRRIIPAVLAVLLAAGVADAALNLVSLDQEWSMRSDLHSQVASQARVTRDDYLSYVGNRIADQTPYGNRQWDFFIVDDPSVNAFNLPGGLVYVHRGLIAEADTLDQFAGALAHEIGHGAARHGTQLMTRAYGYNMIAGMLLGRNAGQGKQLLAQIVGAGVMTNYTRGAETEADRLGVEYAYRAGFDPDGAADFFQQLLQMRQRRPTRVEQFFSSHPLTEDRIRNVEAVASRYPDSRSLLHDSRNYQQFRSRFR